MKPEGSSRCSQERAICVLCHFNPVYIITPYFIHNHCTLTYPNTEKEATWTQQSAETLEKKFILKWFILNCVRNDLEGGGRD